MKSKPRTKRTAKAWTTQLDVLEREIAGEIAGAVRRAVDTIATELKPFPLQAQRSILEAVVKLLDSQQDGAL